MICIVVRTLNGYHSLLSSHSIDSIPICTKIYLMICTARNLSCLIHMNERLQT